MALRLLLLLLLGATVSACENCGPTDEPDLNVFIIAEQLFVLDSLVAEGAIGPLLPALREPLSAQPRNSVQFAVPVNLRADSVRYQLRLDGRWETLTVFYRRDYNYQSPQCGYVVNLLPPAQPTAARSSRGTVQFVNFERNRSILFPGSNTFAGIYVSVRL